MNADERRPGEGSGGIADVLRIATPLILAAAGHAINLFTDRMMLAWHSADAVSAVMPAGLTCFAAMSFFFGTVGYTNAFVSQYTGAKMPHKVGPAVWQGIFLGLIGGALIATGYFWAGPLFKFFGHPPEVQAGEVVYFQILALGGVLPFITVAISAFWSGRGKTRTVMLISFLTTFLNLSVNYMLIFGHCGLPAMGIKGAAIGTIIAEAAGLLVYLWLFLAKESRLAFNTWPERKFDPELFRRLVKYGAPSGIQLFLDIAAFNTFVVLLGRYGKVVQEASSIVFSLNAIVFIPMIGLGQTVSILVGQAVGSGKLKRGKRAVFSAWLLTVAFMGTMGLVFIFCPGPILQLFARAGDPSQTEVFALARSLLLFVAAYTLFDGVFIIYSSAIKGAGDTAFSMWVNAAMAWLFYATPCILAFRYGASFWTLWAILVGYIVLESAVFYSRYRHGAWESMSVIGHKRQALEAP